MQRLVFTVVALGLGADRAVAETFTVAPAQCVIVTTNGADVHTKAAAGELQKHLKLITGMETPIQEGDAAVEGKYVFAVGAPPAGSKPLAREEARWIITKQRADFYGDPYPYRGTQFAVYAFLEEELGVRWIRPGDRGIGYAPRTTLTLTPGEHSWTPQMEMRKIRVYARPGRGYSVLKDYVAEFGAFMTTHEEQDAEARDLEQWQYRMRMGSHTEINYGHAFTDWWDKYSKTHPDYFALNRWGKREPEQREQPTTETTEWTDRDKHGVKLCVSNPKVAGQIMQNWIERAKREKWINVCMNDWIQGFCRCPNCLKLDGRKEGEELGEYLTGLTDRYVYLANQVARLAREHDPDVGVVMYAYETTEQPPRHQRVEPNVAVAIVPTTIDVSALTRLFEGWKKAGATKFLMRPNYPGYYNVLALPKGIEKQMFDAFQVAYKYGVVGTDYDSLTPLWPYNGMTFYILAKAFSDPSKSYEHWENEYCAAYGPSADDVKTYYHYWRTELWDKRLGPNLEKIVTNGKYHNFDRGLFWALGDYYRASDFDAPAAILEKAVARDLSPQQRRMVDELVVANQAARLLVQAVIAQGSAKFEYSKQLLDFRMKHRDGATFNWLNAFAGEARYGDSTGAKIAVHLQQYPFPWIATALAWRFKLDPTDVGQKEKWQDKPWDEVKNWDYLRTDFYWDNPYDSETDPALLAKIKNYDGIAWYASQQTTPTELKGRTVLLYFGGVDESCWVYVNGKLAGTRLSQKPEDERTPFTIRIDPCIDWERAEQTITVRVEDKSGSGGIYKRVWVVSEK